MSEEKVINPAMEAETEEERLHEHIAAIDVHHIG